LSRLGWDCEEPYVGINRRGTDDGLEGQNAMAACKPGSRVASG